MVVDLGMFENQIIAFCWDAKLWKFFMKELLLL